jgi:hypothetical protein
LTRTRFEAVKVSTFAVFLLSIVALAVYRSHILSSENQFGANAAAALQTLAKTVSNQTAPIRGKTDAIARSIKHNVGVFKRPIRTDVARASVRFSFSSLRNFISPDAVAAGIAGLLIYCLFAILLIRRSGGLRAFQPGPSRLN